LRRGSQLQMTWRWGCLLRRLWCRTWWFEDVWSFFSLQTFLRW
jgi:hypothetical protein